MAVNRLPDPNGGIQPSTLTTTGDILYASSAQVAARLGIGSANQALGVSGGVPAYQASSKSTLTTTGDIMYASAANTPARLGIGSSAQVLTVASGIPSWATPATSSSGLNLISTTAFTSVSSVSLATSTFTSTYKHYRFLMTLTSTTSSVLSLRMRTAGADLTSASYQWVQQILIAGPTRADASSGSDTSISFGETGGGGGIPLAFGFDILNPQATDYTWLNIQGTNSNSMNSMVINGYLPITNSFDAFTLLIGSGTITGTIRAYGYGS